MRWGISISTTKPPNLTQEEVLEASLHYASLAERCGYHSAWVLEHHFTPFGLCPDTLLMASFLLGRTENLHVGTATVVAPFQHPVRIAENAALIDQLSDGRLYLGLGRGGFRHDFEVFGIDPTTTNESLRECIGILERAWADGEVGSEGFYNFPTVPVYPRPTRPVPIFVAGESPTTIEWAATRNIPLLMISSLHDHETRATMELYDQTAEMAGYDPEAVEHALFCVAYVADSKREAKQAIEANLNWWSNEGSSKAFTVDQLKKLPNYRFHLRRLEQAVLEGSQEDDYIGRWLDRNPVGTPEQCAERLEEMIEFSGAHHMVLGIEGPANRHLTSDNIARFAAEVFPRVSVGPRGQPRSEPAAVSLAS